MNNITENPNVRLIPFLRELADSIEQKQLSPNQLKSIGEFFMVYKFQEQAVSDNHTETEEQLPDFSKEELVKFVVMGWYIYCCILRGHDVGVTTVD
jgi:hypothetical protein